MGAEAYRVQGQKVSIIEITDDPSQAAHDFQDPLIQSFKMTPSQIEVEKLRWRIWEYLNGEFDHTLIIDSTRVADAETKLALGSVALATAILVRENSSSRERVLKWIRRVYKQSSNVLALYLESSFPVGGVQKNKALPFGISAVARAIR